MIWKPWPRNSFYEVSSEGQVRSKHGLRKVYENPNGYLYLRLRDEGDGKVKTQWVHRLVLEAFVGYCPDGHVAMHLDHDKKNNSVGNLRWGTQADNVKATYSSGRRKPTVKHSDADVREMLRLHRECGWTQKEVAEKFRTTPQYVSELHRGVYREPLLGIRK